MFIGHAQIVVGLYNGKKKYVKPLGLVGFLH